MSWLDTSYALRVTGLGAKAKSFPLPADGRFRSFSAKADAAGPPIQSATAWPYYESIVPRKLVSQ